MNDPRFDVGTDRPHVVTGSRMDGQFRGQVRCDPMNEDRPIAVHTRAHLTMAGSRGDHMHLMAGVSLGPGERPHLRLDPTRARCIAIGDMGDPHSR